MTANTTDENGLYVAEAARIASVKTIAANNSAAVAVTAADVAATWSQGVYNPLRQNPHP